jgi:hypothetical protein
MLRLRATVGSYFRARRRRGLGGGECAARPAQHHEDGIGDPRWIGRSIGPRDGRVPHRGHLFRQAAKMGAMNFVGRAVVAIAALLLLPVVLIMERLRDRKRLRVEATKKEEKS